MVDYFEFVWFYCQFAVRIGSPSPVEVVKIRRVGILQEHESVADGVGLVQRVERAAATVQTAVHVVVRLGVAKDIEEGVMG